MSIGVQSVEGQEKHGLLANQLNRRSSKGAKI